MRPQTHSHLCFFPPAALNGAHIPFTAKRDCVAAHRTQEIHYAQASQRNEEEKVDLNGMLEEKKRERINPPETTGSVSSQSQRWSHGTHGDHYMHTTMSQLDGRVVGVGKWEEEKRKDRTRARFSQHKREKSLLEGGVLRKKGRRD